MAEEQLCGDTFGQAVQVVGQTHDKVIQRHHPDHAALLDDRHSAERVHCEDSGELRSSASESTQTTPLLITPSTRASAASAASPS